MDLSLQGKTALVGGSTQGIGLAAAHELAHLGARVVLLARNEDKLKEACAGLPNPGNGHTWLAADFHQTEVLHSAVAAFINQGETVHILVNNTGGPPGGRAIEAEPDAYLSAFRLHLLGNQTLARLVVPGMKAAGYGRIINVISTSVKQPLPNLGVSNTIRGAVANWAKTLANELGRDGITVNNVLPGPTHTGRLTSIADTKAAKTGQTPDDILHEMAMEVPLQRIGRPEEVAAAIAFLASPAAAYINGINLPVDGGRTGSL